MSEPRDILDFHLYLLASGPKGLLGAIEGGVDLVQFRDKESPDEVMLVRLQQVVRITREVGVPLIINDRPGLVARFDAAGVHLGQGDMSVAIAREHVGPDRIIGVSTHTVEEAMQAEADGADYVAVGPVYPTDSKVVDIEAVGPRMVERVMARVDIPVVAIGGIKASNVDAVVETGCTRVAVIGGILGGGNPLENAIAMRRRMDKAMGFDAGLI
jgi:thiamine-phosphate pyrophosphorylase